MTRVLSLALAVAFVTAAQAVPPVIDGTLDPIYGAALAVQTNETSFGDNLDPTGFGGGGELDAGYAVVHSGKLFLMVTGNQEANFNKISIFIDSVAGGENTLDGGLAYDFSDVAANFGGLTFDAGFEADYHIFGRWGGASGNTYEVDIVDRANSTPGAELGNFGNASVGAGTGIQSGVISAGAPTATTGADAGTFLTADVEFGFNNTNVAGVGGAAPGAADPVAAAAVTTGLELAIDLADLGNPTGLIKIHVAYGNGDNNFHSNQILGGLPVGFHLGGDGAGNFTGNLSGIDFNNFAGDQFFTVTVPEPASALLVGLAMVGLAARRRI